MICSNPETIATTSNNGNTVISSSINNRIANLIYSKAANLTQSNNSITKSVNSNYNSNNILLISKIFLNLIAIINISQTKSKAKFSTRTRINSIKEKTSLMLR